MGAERSRRGITLIELIIVLMVLATMMTLAGPTLSRFMGGRRMTEEARRMIALLHYARQEAISRGEPMLVWFDEEERTYGVEPLYLSGMAALPTADEERVTMRYTLSEGLRLEITEALALPYSEMTGVVYQPDGTLLVEGMEAARLINMRDDEIWIVRLAERPLFVIDDERREDEYTVEEWDMAGYGTAPSSLRR